MSGVGVLDKAVVILAACVDGASLAELVERTKLPRATAHRLAQALEIHRMLVRDAQGRWRPGPRLGELANAAPDILLTAAEPILTGLATTGDPDEMRAAAQHLQQRVHEPDADDPLAAAEEHEKEFAKRQLTCTRLGPHWRISGQLDAETGAALHAVLQGLMAPPGPLVIPSVSFCRYA